MFASKMDVFGILSFAYIIVYSILALSKGFGIMSLILLLIGIGGLCVDSFVVFNAYRKWR